jgi:hypothetical protein
MQQQKEQGFYGSRFLINVEATTPFAAGDDADGEKDAKNKKSKSVGVTITGSFSVISPDFFKPLVGTKFQGFLSIVGGTLPIDGDVALQFIKRNDVMLKFGDLDPHAAIIQSISITPKSGSQAPIVAKIKIKVPVCNEETTGGICNKLRQSVNIELTTTQIEMDLEENSPETPAHIKQYMKDHGIKGRGKTKGNEAAGISL